MTKGGLEISSILGYWFHSRIQLFMVTTWLLSLVQCSLIYNAVNLIIDVGNFAPHFPAKHCYVLSSRKLRSAAFGRP